MRSSICTHLKVVVGVLLSVMYLLHFRAAGVRPFLERPAVERLGVHQNLARQRL
jgi:hypothetical protein